MSHSRSSFVDYKAVKASVSIVQILERYNLLSTFSHSGDSYSGRCPLHQGDNPTQFRVSVSKNCWNCFGKCKRGGNVIDFVSLKEGLSFREAALRIQQWFNLDSKQDSKADKTAAEPESTKAANGATAGISRTEEKEEEGIHENKPLNFALEHLVATDRYIVERGLNSETVATFGIGFCPKGLMACRIAIPIHNAAGALVAYAGRYPGKPPEGTAKYKFPKGFRKSLEVFNYHRAAAADSAAPLIVVEGFFDCMNIWQAGYQRVVAIMGSSLSEPQLEQLVRLAGSDGRILLVFDEDDAGRKGRDDALNRLGRLAFVRVLSCGSEGSQPDQLTSTTLQQLLGLKTPTQRRYVAKRNDTEELCVTIDGAPLDPRFDLRIHSPTGFECGYGGSGSSQLALALLAHHLGDDNRALDLYQDFKWKVVAGMPKSGWTLSASQIDDALRTLELPIASSSTGS